jgi:hypothetical protein
MGSTLTLIFLSRLLRNSSLVWSTYLRLFSEHKIALLMQCLESVTDVRFIRDISLISDAMIVAMHESLHCLLYQASELYYFF